jgi:hypothetical protein
MGMVEFLWAVLASVILGGGVAYGFARRRAGDAAGARPGRAAVEAVLCGPDAARRVPAAVPAQPAGSVLSRAGGPQLVRTAAPDRNEHGAVVSPADSTRPMFPSMASDEVMLLRKDTADGGTYEVYHADTAEAARQFLLKKHVTAQFYYVVVETPEGNWGIDVQGLYLERLLSWQSDISKADVVGRPALGLVGLASAREAALGNTDNFIHGVICGACGREWLDGLRLNRDTVVRCPKCSAMNRVTSPSCHFVMGRE